LADVTLGFGRRAASGLSSASRVRSLAITSSKRPLDSAVYNCSPNVAST
jgi:hypothetical protein